MSAEEKIRELLDYHLSGNLNINDPDCGCTDEEQREWWGHSLHVGDQAFIEHLHAKIMEAINSPASVVVDGRVGQGDLWP